MSIARCQSCARPIAARWRRCPWCKRWTGQPHRTEGDLLDAELQAVASVGVMMGAALTFFGAAFLEGQWSVTLTCWALGLTLIASGLGSLLSAHAVDVALLGWAALLVFSAWPHGPGLATALPAVVVLFLAIRRRKLRAHLRCEASVLGWTPGPQLDLTRCAVCGDAAHGLIAPRLSLGFVFVALLVHARFRVLCLRHARLNAIPATLISFVFGWWSLMGLFWTPVAILDNLREGGVHADDQAARDAAREAALGFRAHLPALAVIGGGVAGLLEGAYIASQLQELWS